MHASILDMVNIPLLLTYHLVGEYLTVMSGGGFVVVGGSLRFAGE
jgi:hypothetical protein